ncbi:uncharacterized protein LOC126837248 isoform X2 [Adelges cooleyi]|uniref:uncharacterized protein LOC126837248 isoform X2 n=1 Tax=Adelges cooleyi TaxID=133065 RepID=UPI0021807CE4|nr:uncharacterized protein LOC126837248 isoform X2 [Adelges cooleyi]
MSERFAKMNQGFAVRCSLCKRVFCCLKHRHDHERREHALIVATPAALIKRRFRPVAPVPKRLQAANSAAPATGSSLWSANGRKRHRTPAPVAAEQERPSLTDSGVRMKETPVRRQVLRARRSSVGGMRLMLRPVAESSPAIPYTPYTPYTTAHQNDTVCKVEDAVTPVVVPSENASPSFYQTPMQQTPMQQTPGHAVLPDGTPVSQKAKKRVSFGPDSTHKGFFWTNVARRVRMALRPAKPKVHDKSPSPTVDCVETARYYNNIQPRRPINEETTLPELDARPSLEAIRMAHEAAVKATLSASSESH